MSTANAKLQEPSTASLEAKTEENEIWISKEEAAKILNVKPRQIQNRTAEGYIRKSFLPRRPDESNPRAVYSKSDVLALKAGKPNQYAVEVEPAKEDDFPAPTGNGSADLERIRAWPQTGGQLDFQPRPGPRQPRAWLTLPEAEEHSGLPEATILTLCKAGYVRAIDLQGQEVGIRTLHRCYRILCASLDAWGLKV
jgi:hypothetical protein